MDLAVEWGQVHALLGENGAGKSTLMNVVYGLVRPDAGEIVFDGKPVQIKGPHDAIRLGIGMVHQHFMLIPPLTVAENIVLGHEVANAGVVADGRSVTATQPSAAGVFLPVQRGNAPYAEPGASALDTTVALPDAIPASSAARVPASSADRSIVNDSRASASKVGTANANE